MYKPYVACTPRETSSAKRKYEYKTLKFISWYVAYSVHVLWKIAELVLEALGNDKTFVCTVVRQTFALCHLLSHLMSLNSKKDYFPYDYRFPGKIICSQTSLRISIKSFVASAMSEESLVAVQL